MSSEQRNKIRLKALIWMVLGSLVIFSSIVIMNQSQMPKKQEAKKTASFEVEKQQQKKEKPKPKPKPKPQKPSTTPKAPVPVIGSAISGLDLGLPEFNLDGMEIGDDILGDMSNVVMTGDTVDDPPRPRTQTPVEYPAKAKAKGITGYVTLNLLISTQGAVENVKLLESYPQGVFEEAATETVRSWKFDPAVYQGKPVKVWAKQKIRFDLN
jgi:protein TonB